MKVTLQEPAACSNPFEDYPQLRTIWPDPAHQQVAEEAAVEDLVAGPQCGPVLLILADSEVVGITGLFPWPDDFRFMGLRWTGVIPSRRREGICENAVRQLFDYADREDWSCKGIFEILPCTEYGNSLKPFFIELGFKPFGIPQYHDWLGSEGQDYLLLREE